jgi:hypothetical protein
MQIFIVMGKKNNSLSKKEEIEFPLFCDYKCKYAAFSTPSSIGACRKELAVLCGYFKRYNNKNNKCFGLKPDHGKNL